jgi:hypothetical protein
VGLPEPERLRRRKPIPLVAVVDACIFPRRDWLAPILDSAAGGFVTPIWSPLIIVETTRAITRRWVVANGGDPSITAQRALSAESKRWFERMTAVFRVAEDCPPHEEAWPAPRDAWDMPIWNAAKRSGADVIVTDNLRDGPPEDADGRRTFQGVLWCHPDVFASMLDRRPDVTSVAAGADQDDAEPATRMQTVLAIFDEARR